VSKCQVKMENKGYRKLRVWNEAHKFALMIYRTTKNFPREEVFGLTSQIRRASTSVAANIVEGQVRGSSRSFIQYLNIANGSLVEVEYYLELAKELKYLTNEQYKVLDEQRFITGNLLNGLIKAIKNKKT